MLNKILSCKKVQVITKKQQKKVKGGIIIITEDVSM